MEHVQDTHRLALMNLMLHGLPSDPAGAGVRYGDTLSPEGQALPKATLMLTNPPFGTKKGGGLPTRTDFTFPTSNKQFAFLQHIYRGLQVDGRGGGAGGRGTGEWGGKESLWEGARGWGVGKRLRG